MKTGQQVQHVSAVGVTDNRGTVSAVRPDGWVRVTWRAPYRGKPRMRVWYPPEVVVAGFLYPANYQR